MGGSRSRFLGSIHLEERLPSGVCVLLDEQVVDRLAADLAAQASPTMGAMAQHFGLRGVCVRHWGLRPTALNQLGSPTIPLIPTRPVAPKHADRAEASAARRPLRRQANLPKLTAELVRESRLLMSRWRTSLATSS